MLAHDRSVWGKLLCTLRDSVSPIASGMSTHATIGMSLRNLVSSGEVTSTAWYINLRCRIDNVQQVFLSSCMHATGSDGLYAPIYRYIPDRGCQKYFDIFQTGR